MTLLFSLWFFLFGLILGSFLNVCIYRLPLEQSIVTPRSHCPQCGRFVLWYHNITVLSFLLLGGKCHHCKKKISIRYPLVELLTGVLSVLVYWKFGGGWPYFFYFVLLTVPLIIITFIDIDHQIIPDIFSLSGIVSGFAAVLVLSPLPWTADLLYSMKGVLAGGGLLFAISWVYEKIRHQEGIGGGDIKLAAMFGAFFGWKGVLFTLLMSSFLGSAIGLLIMVISRKNLKLMIPFGPFLAAAALLHLFYGEEILRWYLQLTLRHY